MPEPSQHAFSEKVSLVVDGATLIGRAVALQLALYGSYVIVATGPECEGDHRILEELTSLGTLAHVFAVDLRDPLAIDRLANSVAEIYGRLDLLVTCMKSPEMLHLDQTTDSEFANVVDTTLTSVFRIIRRLTPLMHDRPRPAIVNVVGEGRDTKDPGDPAFYALNAAVIKLTEALSTNLQGPVRINAVALTGGNASNVAAEILDPELFRPASGVDPDDVARAVIYLLSSESKALNGQILEVG